MSARPGEAFDRVFRPGPDRRLYYGWRIVGAGAMIQMLIAGLFLQAYGAYVVLLQADLGWSRTMLSAGFSMARTESAVLGPAQGWLIDRFGPRTMMRIGVGAFGLGFVLFGLVRSPWQFFVAIMILAIGASFGGHMSVTVALVNWFRRRRATAMGLASMGLAFGGMVVPAVVAFMTAFGWRAAALTSGLLMLVVGPMIVQVVRHKPAELGLHVDGEPPDPEPDETGEADPADRHTQVTVERQPDFTARQAMRTAAFWQIALGHAFAVTVVSALIVHLIPHLTGELGYPLRTAGLVVGFMTLMQLAGMGLGGAFGDRLSKRMISVVAMLMHAAALLALTVAVAPWLLVCFAMLHGLAWGARGPLMQAWRADLFGASNFGTIMGFSSLVVMLGAAGGPLLAGFLYDRLGSYTVTLQLLAALSCLGALLFLVVRRPVPPGVALRSPETT